MPRRSEKRKQWEIALAHAGRTTGQMAKQWGRSKSSVNGVINGTITSADLKAKIDAFITRNLSRAMRSAVEAA